MVLLKSFYQRDQSETFDKKAILYLFSILPSIENVKSLSVYGIRCDKSDIAKFSSLLSENQVIQYCSVLYDIASNRENEFFLPIINRNCYMKVLRKSKPIKSARSNIPNPQSQ